MTRGEASKAEEERDNLSCIPPATLPTLLQTMPSSNTSDATRLHVRSYPASLSRGAKAFKTSIVLSDRVVDGVVFKQVFDGKHAVDVLSELINSDRTIALLFGRALDAQQFFHHVNLEHRLRGSPSELYQFNDPPIDIYPLAPRRVESIIVDNEDLPSGVFSLLLKCYTPTCSFVTSTCYSISCPRRAEKAKRLADELGRVGGRTDGLEDRKD
ncbi:hypothetical protein BDY24DRAFT_414314 [Mrakia frigida]|uniref:uncharacterized protein n=1 Tax=Mrakia frigida TaxID=29902 RepID=UPI003FCC111C